MKKSFMICLLVACAFVIPAFAQTEDPDMKQKGFENVSQAGKLFSLDLEREDSLLKLMITGKRAGSVQIKESDIEIMYGIKNQKRLMVKRETDPKTGKVYFRIQTEEPTLENLNIRIRSSGEEESFNIPRL